MILKNEATNVKPLASTLAPESVRPKLLAYNNTELIIELASEIDVLFNYVTTNLCGKAVTDYEYIVNAELSPAMPSLFGSNSELAEFCHLRRGTNGEVSMPGINSPMYYVGIAGTVSEIHVEDGHLGSLNGVWFNYGSGDERPSKLWLIVPDSQVLNAAIAKEKIVSNPCRYPTNHKNLFVTPAFLRARGIRFDVVVQFPGDIIRVAPGVHHQIINLSCNYAEATNYGCNRWNVVAEHVGICSCTDNRISVIGPNLGSRQIVTSRHLKVYPCTQQGCGFVETSFERWGKHMKDVHANQKPFRCTECGQRWARSKQLTDHVCNDEYVECTVSEKRLRGRLDRHLKTASHVRNERAATVTARYLTVRSKTACDHCNKTVSEADQLLNHTAHCQGVKCGKCDVSFSTQRSYRRHVRTKHPEL